MVRSFASTGLRIGLSTKSVEKCILDFFEDANHMYIVQEFINGFNLMAFFKGVPRIE
jgi:hypothetical protein